MAGRVLSSGILVMHAGAELLLAHATGARHWDLPKGLVDEGESPREAAVREAAEECGLTIDPGQLLELGRFAYRPQKDLHLFATLAERFDPSTCRCTSQFRDRFGRMVPEADAFEWTPFEAVAQRCAKSMTAVLSGPVSLRDVLERLLANSPRA
jgi:8-oxo-dGTP pyrophosphatase MutT (NUDIX family)